MRHGGSIPKRMCTSSLVEEEEDWVQYSSEEELVKEVPDMEDDVDFCGRVLNQQPLYDKMLNLEIELENGYIWKVANRIVAPDGRALGTYNDIPPLNTMMYEIEFDDGNVKEYEATMMADDFLAQVDDDGFSTSMMKAIVDWENDNAYVTDRLGR